MTQPEARLQRKIQEAIKVEGYFCFKIHGSEFMMAGLPDIIVCAEGLFIGLEVKMPGQKAKPRQEYVHSLIRDSGGAVYVVCSVSEALEAISETLVKAGIVV